MVNKQKGFSLIELMLVVLIISIITAVCMPGYVRYVQRARLTEILLPVLRGVEQNVAVFYLANGVMPGTAEFSIITAAVGAENLQVSLDAGEIRIVIIAPGLTDKIHIFNGQEIRATPKLRGGQLSSFGLSGDLAVALGYN